MKCNVTDCDNQATKRGLCNLHYVRFNRYGDVNISKYIRKPPKICTFNGCTRKYHAKGYCQKHYNSLCEQGNKKLRSKLFIIIGAKCTCKGINCYHVGPCGITDLRCIQADHIKGGGRKDRIKHKNIVTLYRYYINHPEEAKKELQPLCANCNWVKREVNKELIEIV